MLLWLVCLPACFFAACVRACLLASHSKFHTSTKIAHYMSHALLGNQALLAVAVFFGADRRQPWKKKYGRLGLVGSKGPSACVFFELLSLLAWV